jgi:hypothetical protein
VLAWIGQDQLIPHRSPEDRVQHDVIFPHRSGSQAVTTIRDWRTDGKGPCAIKVGGCVRFATSDVLAWLLRQRETEPGHGPSGG